MAGRMLGCVRVQAGVRHIITGFFLGAGASGGGEAREGRAASWQATQHRNRLQARGRALVPRRSPSQVSGRFEGGRLLSAAQRPTNRWNDSKHHGWRVPGRAGGCLPLMTADRRSDCMERCTTLAEPSDEMAAACTKRVSSS